MNIVLTRYLYDREGVVRSLIEAITEKRYESALFWAYELYYSGFRKELWKLMWAIYQHRFSQHHPKLGVYIRSKIEIDKAECIATVIKNLTMKNPDRCEADNVKFVNVKEHHTEKYRTREPIRKTWKYLSEVCSHSISSISFTETEERDRLTLFREHWLYHASFSPVWKERIAAYSGKIDEPRREVSFGKEVDSEAFYEKYGFEPDEQSLELQKKCMGLS